MARNVQQKKTVAQQAGDASSNARLISVARTPLIVAVPAGRRTIGESGGDE